MALAIALSLTLGAQHSLAMERPVEQKLKVFCFDGGGIRGIIPAVQCAVIEKVMEKPISELVDVLGGTSTGGVLASALAYGLSADDILTLYTKCGREIFKMDTTNHFNIAGWFTTQYNSEPLNIIFKDLLAKGNSNTQCMFKTNDESDSTNLKVRTFLTGFCMTEQMNILADSSNKDWQVNELWQMLRMTSAAPTFFDPAVVSFNQRQLIGCIDGGLYANDPAHEITQHLIKEHMYLFKDQKKKVALEVFSLGTGAVIETITSKDVENKSALSLAPRIIGTLFNSNANLVFKNMCLTAEKEAYDHQHDRLYLSNYIRIQPDLSHKGAGEMDNTAAENIEALLNRSFEMVKTEKFKEILEGLGYVSQGNVSKEIEDAIAKIKDELAKINVEKISHLQLVGVINDYILEVNQEKLKTFFSGLMLEKPPLQYLDNLSIWINKMREVNAIHNGQKTVGAWLKNKFVPGKHDTIESTLKDLEEYVKSANPK